MVKKLSSIKPKKKRKQFKLKFIKKPMNWTQSEDKILIEKAKENNYKNWAKTASYIKGRTAIQCSARYKRIKPGLIKGSWTQEEDNQLLKLYKQYGKNWSDISKFMPYRTGKQIRDRFLNALDKNLNKEKFSEEEDEKIIKWYYVYGNSWCKIATKLKGRTGDMIKNRFYSSLKKIIEKNKNKRIRKKIKFKKNCNDDIINDDNNKNNFKKKRKIKKNIKKKTKNANTQTDLTYEDYLYNKINKCDFGVNTNLYIPLNCDINSLTSINSNNFYNYEIFNNNNNSFNNNNNNNQTQKDINFFIPSNTIQNNIILNIQNSYENNNNNNNNNINSLDYNSNNFSNFDENNFINFNYNLNINKNDNENLLVEQNKIETLKNLINSQTTNGLQKENLQSQLEILKEIKTIINNRLQSLNSYNNVN